MKRERPKTTFVGPITKSANSYSFLILQGGMDPIKLEYPTQMVSRQSRAQLLETHHTYPVPSTKLLMAIQQALNEEHGTPLQQQPNEWDETACPDAVPGRKRGQSRAPRPARLQGSAHRTECRVKSTKRQLS